MFTLSIFSGTIQWILSAHDIKFGNGILKREIWNLEKEIGLEGLGLQRTITW